MFRIVLNKNQSDGVSHEGPKHTKPSQSAGVAQSSKPQAKWCKPRGADCR